MRTLIPYLRHGQNKTFLEITILIAFLGLFSTNSILNLSNSLFYCNGSQSNDSSNSNVTILP
jgi:hypothetical protein